MKNVCTRRKQRDKWGRKRFLCECSCMFNTISWVPTPLNHEESHKLDRISWERTKKPGDYVHFKGVRINKNKYMGLFNLRVQHTALVNYRVDNLFSLLSNIIGINDDWRLKNIVYFTCAPVTRSLSISKHKTLVLHTYGICEYCILFSVLFLNLKWWWFTFYSHKPDAINLTMSEVFD